MKDKECKFVQKQRVLEFKGLKYYNISAFSFGLLIVYL